MKIRPQKIAIIGNNLAAWMACAYIINITQKIPVDVVVYSAGEEAEDDVVQSVLPTFKACLKGLGLGEKDLVDCEGLEKVGTSIRHGENRFNFVWGDYGAQRGAVEFQQLLVRMKKTGVDYDINRLSIASAMIEKSFFKSPDINRSSIFSTYDYSYSFSTQKLKLHLRKKCIDNAITECDETISSVGEEDRHGKISLSNGEHHRYDFVINASSSPYLINYNDLYDWRGYLPYQKVRGEAMPVTNKSYCSVVELKGGFDWTKQHTSLTSGWIDGYQSIQANGASENALPPVYCAKKIGSGGIVNIGAPAIHLPSPLFSPSDLAWCALRELGEHFPVGQNSPCLMKQYNAKMQSIYQRMRDITQWVFIAGSVSKGRGDHQHFDISIENQHKLDYFQKRGRIPFYEDEEFNPQWQVWLSMGLGLSPGVVDPLVMSIPDEECQKVIEAVDRAVVKNTALALNSEN